LSLIAESLLPLDKGWWWFCEKAWYRCVASH